MLGWVGFRGFFESGLVKVVFTMEAYTPFPQFLEEIEGPLPQGLPAVALQGEKKSVTGF